MMMVNLYCPKCRDDTVHTLLPWQTKAGQFDALSAICTAPGCDRVAVMVPQEFPDIVVAKKV